MGANSFTLNRKLLYVAVASCLAGVSGTVAAQENTQAMEEVLVTGIKRAQADAVNMKRDAVQVVDGISAEDIGKLPDVTITDSLQRVSGVQVRRSAGEGGKINIRGLDKVATQLNGESFLAANALTTSTAELGNLPSQLFKGTEIYKSAAANNGAAGITGTINLKTWRPMDFGEGLTRSLSFELQSGADTGETDPVMSGLVNWNNDTIGFMVSGSYANVNLGNNYNGVNTGAASGDAGWMNNVHNYWGPQDGLDYNYAVPQGVAAWNQVTERERYGINGSFQADLGEGFEFVADVFVANQEEYNRKQGVSITDKWSGSRWANPISPQNTGAYSTIDFADYGSDPDAAPDLRSMEWLSFESRDISPRRIQSFSQNDIFFTDSANYNFELNYDDGGKFTSSTRFIYAEGTNKKRHGYVQGDTMDGNSTGIWNSEAGTGTFYPSEYCNGADAVGDDGGCYVEPNPLGWRGVGDDNVNPALVYDTSGDHPAFSGFDQVMNGGLAAGTTLEGYLANIDSYNVAASVSENNQNSTAELRILRFDGGYKFDDGGFFTSLDFGARFSQRNVEEYRYHLFSNFYAGATDENGQVMADGCAAQWKATDVSFGGDSDCSVGEIVDGDFVGYTALPPTALDANNNVKFVTDFGGATGLPGVWVADPNDLDDPEAYQKMLYGNASKQMIPGTSYEVQLIENSLFAQGNFEFANVRGNLGLRAVETQLAIKQNVMGDQMENGNTNIDDGDVYASSTYYDLLPSLNASMDLADNVILRAAWAKNMMPLDLNQWGDGLSVNFARVDEPGSANHGKFRATTGSANGNPALEPWRSTNYDIGLEWYAGEASMAHISLFMVDVDSFVQAGSTQMTVADETGYTDISVSTPVQGDSGDVSGVEIGGKLAMSDFMSDGFFSGFGFDANYTFSPSTQQEVDVYGDELEFPDNSEHQVNLIGWYEAGGFQARVAYNYRSERLDAISQVSGFLPLYQDAISYVDMSVSYDVMDDVTVYLNGSNITSSYEEYYLQWEDNYAFQREYEARYTLGIRAKF
ncbi:TonB-dependent receptor [Teredinibacter haidensis]|uniref:TonB-dependent receptor n=1 Tax=Teredinibacter haidensis TaxID=2731755 RepID=UPI00163BC618|nr:TonB-dependent receptor [Teredinibacter haidensis]